MIKIAFLVLACVLSCQAMGYGYNAGYGAYGYGGYGYGANRGAPSFNEAGVNTINAQRQLAVNAKANWIGRSSGTAYKDGVPGTPLGVTGYGYHGHHGGYGGYGHHGAYGYGGYGYGHGGYGYGGHSGAH